MDSAKFNRNVDCQRACKKRCSKRRYCFKPSSSVQTSVHRICCSIKMGWATPCIQKLRNGETVSFRPRGHSMKGRIESGQLCTVEPIQDFATLQKDDIVLCKVNGREYLHLIKAVQGARFQIGNNRGLINGWVGANSIFGRCTKIED